MKAFFYEAGQDFVDMAALTDDGTHQFFYSSDSFWSNYSGRTPTVLPNGIVSGGVVTPAASETNDAVDVSEISAWLNGVKKTGASKIDAVSDAAVIREATNGYLIASIVITAAGAIDVIEGTAHASAHSSVRGADGGPPYIPVDNIEVAHIVLTGTASAAITADEIKQVPGVSQEYALDPTFQIKFSNVSDGVAGYAGVYFSQALPLIHTGDTAKKVFAEYYTPQFGRMSGVRDFDPSRVTGSASSETFYDGPRASVSESINSGSFEFAPDDVVSHPFFKVLGKEIWLKYKPDDLSTPYMVCQGRCYESGSHPADGLTVYSMNIVSQRAMERIIS